MLKSLRKQTIGNKNRLKWILVSTIMIFIVILWAASFKLEFSTPEEFGDFKAEVESAFSGVSDVVDKQAPEVVVPLRLPLEE